MVISWIILSSAVSFESPMHVSSPDMFAPKLQLNERLGMDLVEDSTTREYAAEIFTYLKEAEVCVNGIVFNKVMVLLCK